MKIPTIEQLMKCYAVVAVAERAKSGRPCERTVENALAGMRNICAAAAIPLEAPITRLTRKAIDAALATLLERGVSRVTARSYVWQMRSVFARWTRGYYVDAGWKVKLPELPSFLVKSPRYVRPSAAQLAAVKAWYSGLKGSVWFAATMMLEFAMRNGDVLRLRDENFVERSSAAVAGIPRGKAESRSDALAGVRHALPSLQHYLSYTPHKTELTSGRRVFWPVHPDIWARIRAEGGVAAYDITDEAFGAINKAMRAMGFSGSKGAYELRKICIDHIYQKYGAEMAVSISGDDIKTISRYYADPATPNVGAVRVVEML